jgi:hypothetical protein
MSWPPKKSRKLPYFKARRVAGNGMSQDFGNLDNVFIISVGWPDIGAADALIAAAVDVQLPTRRDSLWDALIAATATVANF